MVKVVVEVLVSCCVDVDNYSVLNINILSYVEMHTKHFPYLFLQYELNITHHVVLSNYVI